MECQFTIFKYTCIRSYSVVFIACFETRIWCFFQPGQLYLHSRTIAAVKLAHGYVTDLQCKSYDMYYVLGLMCCMLYVCICRSLVRVVCDPDSCLLDTSPPMRYAYMLCVVVYAYVPHHFPCFVFCVALLRAQCAILNIDTQLQWTEF